MARVAEGNTLAPPLVFLWGCLGGLLAYIVLFALPELLRAYYTTKANKTPLRKVVIAGLIGLFFIALGGGTALLLGDVNGAQEAIAYGLAGEGLIAGGFKGIVDSVRPHV
ncbi:hypothetical protein GCM10027080_37110 [Pedococcus soli]